MKRKVRAEDLYDIRLLKDAGISRAGDMISYTKTIIDKDSQEYVDYIFIYDIGKRSQAELCRGSHFIWNHSGDKGAFVVREGGRSQIWVYDFRTESCRQLTAMRYGATEPLWSDDDLYIYYLSECEEGLPSEILCSPMSDEEEKKAEADQRNRGIHVTDIVYKFEGRGYLSKRKSHIWKIDVDNKLLPVKLTSGQNNYRQLSVSNDGQKLVFVSDPVSNLDFRPQDINLWIYDINTGSQRLLVDDKIYIENPVFLKGDRKILFAGHEGEYGWGTIKRLYIYDLEQGKFYCVSKAQDLSIGDTALSDMRSGTWRGFVLCKNGAEVYFTVSYRGNTNIYKWSEGGKIELFIGKECQIYDFSADEEGSSIVAIYTDPLTPNNISLFRVNPENGIKKCEDVILIENSEFIEQCSLSKPEKISFKSFDGVEIEGWVMLPANFQAGYKYPCVLEIHGGPQMMYANAYVHEFQLLAANGYVVCYLNPRGSSGYGQKFKSLIRREYGGIGSGDYKDLLSGLDYAIGLGFVDKENLFVTGGSYGGFMTNWIVGHTDRFKAAVTQRSISNWVSFTGTSDYGYCDAELAHQCDCFGENEELERISPITYVENIATPLFIIHSECDLRCPLEQAQQLFVKLKLLKKTVEMKIFPDSNHGLSRDGRPALRVERLNTIVDWFNRFRG